MCAFAYSYCWWWVACGEICDVWSILLVWFMLCGVMRKKGVMGSFHGGLQVMHMSQRARTWTEGVGCVSVYRGMGVGRGMGKGFLPHPLVTALPGVSTHPWIVLYDCVIKDKKERVG